MTLDPKNTEVHSELPKKYHQSMEPKYLVEVYHVTIFFITGRFMAIKSLDYLRTVYLDRITKVIIPFHKL